jgi:hypothetical protein
MVQNDSVLVYLVTGKTARIFLVTQSKANPRLVYVHFEPDLKTIDPDSCQSNPQAYYREEDIYRLADTASKLVKKEVWPRELRLLVLSIPITLVLFYLGWLGLRKSYFAGVIISLLPLFIKKRRIKVIRSDTNRVSDAVIQGSAYGLLTIGSTLDSISVQTGVWFTPATLIFQRPSFWE